MKLESANPKRNALAAGVTESAVVAAIARSGYPLQGVVAAKLASTGFYVQEEWSYLDRDTKNLRNIDIVASRMLHEHDQPPDLRVRPQVDLIVECKKSELPYVFFNTRQSSWLADFPVIAGLRTKSISLRTDDSRSSWLLPVLMALGLTELPFMTTPPLCSTLSKCVRRQGGELELSGDDTYNGLVLPLVKAASHFEGTEVPIPTHVYFNAHLAIPLAVMDAPMVLATTDGASIDTELKPWVRVVRHDYQDGVDGPDAHRLCALDVVHIDFFDSYMRDHLLPFASEFSHRTLRHQDELATGEGFATGLEADSHTNVEGRMTGRRRLTKGRAK